MIPEMIWRHLLYCYACRIADSLSSAQFRNAER